MVTLRGKYHNHGVLDALSDVSMTDDQTTGPAKPPNIYASEPLRPSDVTVNRTEKPETVGRRRERRGNREARS